MLQKVSIQNFKSLKDVTLELQKVNLLIGPNNSGKSNFLKALELWGKYISHQSEETKFVKNINDLEEISFKRNRENLGFKMIFDEEIINATTNKTNTNKIDFQVSTKDDSQISHQIEETLNNINIHKILPEKLTYASPISGGDVIKHKILKDGSNIIPFLDYLKDEHKSSYRKLEHDLQKCIPEFTDINLKTVKSPDNDQRTYKIWGLGNENEKYWAEDLSEGVLYFLALLCIVHQPNPPKLLLLEEPEKGIHPRRIKEVIDFIFQLAEDKDIQVIMTTHSERVLDEFEDIPEAVFVFDKDEEGATQVKNLLRDIVEPSDKLMDSQNLPRIKFVESLGSHWVTGFIGGVPR
jgi:AAA15 family ATPase/GTPase